MRITPATLARDGQGTEEPEPTAQHEPSEAAAAAPEPTPVTSIPGVVADKPAPIEDRPRAAPRVKAEAASATSVVGPPNREALLSRLRERAGKLAPERVQQILAARTAR